MPFLWESVRVSVSPVRACRHACATSSEAYSSGGGSSVFPLFLHSLPGNSLVYSLTGLDKRRLFTTSFFSFPSPPRPILLLIPPSSLIHRSFSPSWPPLSSSQTWLHTASCHTCPRNQDHNSSKHQQFRIARLLHLRPPMLISSWASTIAMGLLSLLSTIRPRRSPSQIPRTFRLSLTWHSFGYRRPPLRRLYQKNWALDQIQKTH